MSHFQKIRELWLEGNEEDQIIAGEWLAQLIGEDNAVANLWVLSYQHDSEDDEDYVLDEDNFLKMKFETYPIRFGKDYRYRVTIAAKLNGEIIVDGVNDYSRYDVGNGQPKFDFILAACDKLRKNGIVFYDELFISQKKVPDDHT